MYDLPLAATFGRERLRDPDVLLPFWDKSHAPDLSITLFIAS
jgi:hypothetical protein